MNRRTLLASCGSVAVSLGLAGCAGILTQKNEPLPIFAENDDTVDHSATIIAHKGDTTTGTKTVEKKWKYLTSGRGSRKFLTQRAS